MARPDRSKLNRPRAKDTQTTNITNAVASAPATSPRPAQAASPGAGQPQQQQARPPAPVQNRVQASQNRQPAQPPTPMQVQTQVQSQKDLLFQKVAIFVDAENIELSGLKHHEGRTDYRKIISQVGDREIVRILYYKPAYKEISKTFQSFWAGLGGEIKRPQKNADSFLIIDAVTMSEKIDVAIILGGDKDFLPLVWYLKSRGCRVEIWSWPESTSPEVQEGADFYFPLTKEYVMQGGTKDEV